MSVGKRIKSIREKRRLSQEVLAELAGVPRPHLTKIEGDRVATPRMETLGKLAAHLGVTAEWLRDGDRKSVDADLPFIDFRAGMVEVPLVAEVACGEPMDYISDETVLIPASYEPDASKGEYLVRARGDSMIEHGIQDGWYAVVEARTGGVAASGELILAWYEPANGNAPGGITLKRWFRKGGRKILQGSTPETTFELADDDVFELRGIVRAAFAPPIFFPRISG